MGNPDEKATTARAAAGGNNADWMVTRTNG